MRKPTLDLTTTGTVSAATSNIEKGKKRKRELSIEGKVNRVFKTQLKQQLER